MRFAVKVTINEKGRKRLFESIQMTIYKMDELPVKLWNHDIKDSDIKTIEIIESSHWDGYKH